MKTDYLAALSRFGSMIDPKTGIIKELRMIKLARDDPSVFIAQAEPSDTSPLIGLKASNHGAACASTPERALVRAAGESIERYCSTFFDFDSMLVSTPFELRKKGVAFIHTEELYPYAEWQYSSPGFPFKRATENMNIRWVPGQSTIDGSQVLLPASVVYVPYHFVPEVEPFTHMSISTGLAAGPSFNWCVEKGVQEILERDAFMIVWNKKVRVPPINIESCFGHLPELDNLLLRGMEVGAQWLINCITVDVPVPVFSAMLINNGPRPLTSLGIAADIDPLKALSAAVEEALLTRVLLNHCTELHNPRYIHKDCSTLRGHLLSHATDPRLRKALQFLEGDQEMSLSSVVNLFFTTSPISSILELVCAEGFHPISFDVTTEDVAETGIHVVRTVMAGTQPLDNDHRYRYLGGSRLEKVPYSLPYDSLPADEINPDPHPFP